MSGETALIIQWVGGWLGTRTDLNVVAKRRIYAAAEN
jgi:hypothetical protein